MMEPIFDPTLSYDKSRDLRDWSFWKTKLQTMPNGCLYVLVAPRRAGKTWALRGLEVQTGCQYIDLKVEGDDALLSLTAKGPPLLIDEAGTLIRSEPRSLLRKCRDLKGKGRVVFLAATPGEYEQLSIADPDERLLNLKDVQYLPILKVDEITHAAAGAAWARDLVPDIPEPWKRNAYLLACALSVAAKADKSTKWTADLERDAVALAGRNDYVRSVFYEGLSVTQRATVRAAGGQHVPSDPRSAMILRNCGITDHKMRILDPVIAHHCRPPIVVHHVSDVHVGPKSAPVADAKDRSATGVALTAAAGARLVRDEYLNHIEREARPHLVALTGDLVEHGNDATQLDDAVAWLTRLSALACASPHPDLGADDPRVVVVGGNHDVDWSKSSVEEGGELRHKPFGDRLQAYPHPDLHVEWARRRSPFVHYRGCRLSILLLGSAEFGGSLDFHGAAKEKDEDWLTYLCRLLEADEIGPERDRLRRVLQDLGVDLEKVGDRLEIQRVDPGFVAKATLDRSHGERESAERLRLALLHHPLSPLPSAPEIGRYAGLTNAGQVKDALFALEAHLVLHGHQHRGFFAEERWPTRYTHAVRIAAAPSLGSKERDESNGYNEIRIYREGDALFAIEARSVRFQGAGWRAENDAMPMRFLVAGSLAEEWNVSVNEEK